MQLHANVNSQDTNPEKRKTALHYIIAQANAHPEKINQYLKCLATLLAFNADLSIKDASNKTPMQYNKQVIITDFVRDFRPPEKVVFC